MRVVSIISSNFSKKEKKHISQTLIRLYVSPDFECACTLSKKIKLEENKLCQTSEKTMQESIEENTQ